MGEDNRYHLIRERQRRRMRSPRMPRRRRRRKIPIRAPHRGSNENAGRARRFLADAARAARSVAEEREASSAIDELDALTLVDRRLVAIREGPRLTVVHPERHRPVGFLVLVLFDLVADVRAAGGTCDRRNGVAPAAADLMAQDAAQDAAGDHADP